MKKIIILLFLIWKTSFSQDTNSFNYNYLQSTWLSVLEGGYSYECPDAIDFIDEDEYVIYNDCEGLDITNPIVEKGRYKIKEGDVIVLYDREFLMYNYYFLEFFGKESSLSFKVKELEKEKLILGFSKGKDGCLTLYFNKI